jgi:hypothetical protein
MSARRIYAGNGHWSLGGSQETETAQTSARLRMQIALHRSALATNRLADDITLLMPPVHTESRNIAGQVPKQVRLLPFYAYLWP